MKWQHLIPCNEEHIIVISKVYSIIIIKYKDTIQHYIVCICCCIMLFISDAHEEELRSHFEKCGDITNVRLIRDKETRLGKGFGYVQFMVS